MEIEKDLNLFADGEGDATPTDAPPTDAPAGGDEPAQGGESTPAA